MELLEVLQGKSISDLNKLQTIYNVTGNYVSKQILANTLAEAIKKQYTLALEMISNDSAEDLHYLIEEGRIYYEDILPENSDDFMALYDACILDGDLEEGTYTIFEELRPQMKSMSSSMELTAYLENKRDKYEILNNYKNAVLNFQGAISVADYMDIVDRFENLALLGLTRNDVMEYLCRRQAMYNDFQFVDGYMVNNMATALDDEKLRDWLISLTNKVDDTWTKDDLLNYNDEDYYEDNPEINELKAYIRKQIIDDEDIIDCLVFDTIQSYRKEMERGKSAMNYFVDAADLSCVDFRPSLELSSKLTSALNTIDRWIVAS